MNAIVTPERPAGAGVCVLGGTGFVGRSTVGQLCAAGFAVRVLTRERRHARALLVLPGVEIVEADPHDDAVLARHFAGAEAVVNLVGILHSGPRASFEAVHVDLPRRVANACRAAGVRRLVHLSALGASAQGPSEYLRSRGRGESALALAAGPVSVTVLRPSVIFGREDTFLNLFATLVRLFPVVPLAGAAARFQPVWVEDVARAVVRCLQDERTAGQTLELGGPRIFTLAELVRYVAEVTGRNRLVVALPGWAAKIQAAALQHVPAALVQPFFPVSLPGPLMTPDNLRSMSVDNVCAGPFPEVLGFAPADVDAVVPGYLGRAGARNRFSDIRHRAGR